MNPLVSVIIPVYNHARVLKQAVVSILKQTYRPLEIIIINDGSTDDFAAAVKTVDFEDVPHKILNQENKGAPAARNRGLRESAGEYIIFWDADTVARPQTLEKLKRALDQNPTATYAYCSFYFGWKRMPGRPFDAAKLKELNYIDVTALIRRVQAAPFDEKIKRFQDWDLWLTLLEQNKTGVFVPETLYKKIVGARRGISAWRPSFVYRLPWKTQSVKNYEAARALVLAKHGLN